MEKKSIFLTVFVFIFIFILFTKDQALVANNSDLNKMMDVIDEIEGKVTAWQIIAREPFAISFEQRFGQKEQWERKYPEFTWKEREEKGEWVILGEHIDRDDMYKETIQIVTTRLNSMYEGFILYELKGTKWTETTRHTTETKINDVLPQLFYQTPTLFTCITGVYNERMDLAVMEKALHMNELLQGEVVEKLEEKHFVSLTAKSPYFSNELTANEKTFNVQISVRKNDRGDAVFAIGTPILTIEY